MSLIGARGGVLGAAGVTNSVIYGNNDVADYQGTVYLASVGLSLRKITIDRTVTNPTLGAYINYVLNSTSYQATLCIYNSSLDRVAYSSPFLDPDAASPWLASYERQVTATLSSGDYWVGHLSQEYQPMCYSTGTANLLLWNETDAPWNTGIPPESLTDGTSSSENGLVWLIG